MLNSHYNQENHSLLSRIPCLYRQSMNRSMDLRPTQRFLLLTGMQTQVLCKARQVTMMLQVAARQEKKEGKKAGRDSENYLEIRLPNDQEKP